MPSKYVQMLRRAGDERTILFHAVRHEVAALNCQVEAVDDLAAFPPHILNDLVGLGFLVQADSDETRQLDRLAEHAREGTSTLRLAVITGYACNLRCSYCFVPEVWAGWGRSVPTVSMSRGVVERLIEFAASVRRNTGFSRLAVDFVGLGEPLLQGELVQFAMDRLSRFASSEGVEASFIVVTNGTTITDDLALGLRPFHPLFQISVDGRRSFHNMRRPYKDGGGTYDRIMQTIEILTERDMRCSVRVNMSDDEMGIADLADDLIGVAGQRVPVALLPVLPASPGACAASSGLGKGLVSAMAQAAAEILRRGLIVATALSLMPLPCYGCSRMSFAVDMFGEVYPCEGAVGNVALRIGELPLSDANGCAPSGGWSTERGASPCADCALRPMCGGVCPAWQHFGFRPGECTKTRDLVLLQTQIYIAQRYPTWFDPATIGSWNVITYNTCEG